MLAITGGTVVLPGGATAATLLVEGAVIAAVSDAAFRLPVDVTARIDAGGGVVIPGLIDLHVHGVEGHDVHDEGGAVARMAESLPRFGVTAFCPTTVACAPDALRRVLEQVRDRRGAPFATGARVLGAHLESNFINPAMHGAQPIEHVRLPPGRDAAEEHAYSGADVLAIIEAWADAVAIVTVAPELPGALDLIRRLGAAGIRVSLGHSSADFETAMQAFDAGARQVTHLFNRMAPMTHRAPGLAGAALLREDVIAELICDAHHVHPATARLAIGAKGPSGIAAITDGTAGSGLPSGSCARLGGRTIRVGDRAATLEDGTLAGSTLTMDGAFRMLLTSGGRSLPDAVLMCATTPARALGLGTHGIIAPGAAADLVVLDDTMHVVHTMVGGHVVYSRPDARSNRGDTL